MGWILRNFWWFFKLEFAESADDTTKGNKNFWICHSFKAVVRIYFGCICPSAQPNVLATSQKISWRQWNTKLRAKILIFFENIWPLQTFTNFLLGDKSLKYFSSSNEIGPVTGTARFFGEGCIFGGNIWIWIFPLVVSLDLV